MILSGLNGFPAPSGPSGTVLTADSAQPGGVKWARAAVPMLAQSTTNVSMPFATGHTTASIGSSTANTAVEVRFVPFPLNFPVTVNAVNINVSTQATDANSTAQIGLFAANDVGRPDIATGRVLASGLSITSTGVKTGTLASPLKLDIGFWWLAIAAQMATTAGTNPVFQCLSGPTFLQRTGTDNNVAYQIYGTKPSSSVDLMTLSLVSENVYTSHIKIWLT